MVIDVPPPALPNVPTPVPVTSSIDRNISTGQTIVGPADILPSTSGTSFPASSPVANSAVLPTDVVIGDSSALLNQHKLLYDQNEMYRVMSICQSLGKQMTALLDDMGVSE